MFLLDTMVISESGRRTPHAAVTSWLAELSPRDLFVSTITFGEIAAGIAQKRTAEPNFSDRLERWSIEVREHFAERTLPVTTEIALRWGELYVRLKRRDMDLVIAATALEHDLTVATRNIRHFAPTGVSLFNPYDV